MSNSNNVLSSICKDLLDLHRARGDIVITLDESGVIKHITGEKILNICNENILNRHISDFFDNCIISQVISKPVNSINWKKNNENFTSVIPNKLQIDWKIYNLSLDTYKHSFLIGKINSSYKEIQFNKYFFSIPFESFNSQNTIFFIKDANSNFQFCSNKMKAVTNMASELDVSGLTDYEMPWKDFASKYRSDDDFVIKHSEPLINLFEPIFVNNYRAIPIRTSKYPINNSNGEAIGLYGCFEIIEPFNEILIPNYLDTTLLNTLSQHENKFVVETNDLKFYLTKKQIELCLLHLEGCTAKKIAKIFKLSYRTIEDYNEKLKDIFKANTKEELITILKKSNILDVVI